MITGQGKTMDRNLQHDSYMVRPALTLIQTRKVTNNDICLKNAMEREAIKNEVLTAGNTLRQALLSTVEQALVKEKMKHLLTAVSTRPDCVGAAAKSEIAIKNMIEKYERGETVMEEDNRDAEQKIFDSAINSVEHESLTKHLEDMLEAAKCDDMQKLKSENGIATINQRQCNLLRDEIAPKSVMSDFALQTVELTPSASTISPKVALVSTEAFVVHEKDFEKVAGHLYRGKDQAACKVDTSKNVVVDKKTATTDGEYEQFLEQSKYSKHAVIRRTQMLSDRVHVNTLGRHKVNELSKREKSLIGMRMALAVRIPMDYKSVISELSSQHNSLSLKAIHLKRMNVNRLWGPNSLSNSSVQVEEIGNGFKIISVTSARALDPTSEVIAAMVEELDKFHKTKSNNYVNVLDPKEKGRENEPENKWPRVITNRLSNSSNGILIQVLQNVGEHAGALMKNYHQHGPFVAKVTGYSVHASGKLNHNEYGIPEQVYKRVFDVGIAQIKDMLGGRSANKEELDKAYRFIFPFKSDEKDEMVWQNQFNRPLTLAIGQALESENMKDKSIKKSQASQAASQPKSSSSHTRSSQSSSPSVQSSSNENDTEQTNNTKSNVGKRKRQRKKKANRNARNRSAKSKSTRVTDQGHDQSAYSEE